MTDGNSIAWKLAATALFVALNGFFVAAEFALVKVRATRIEALARRGSKRAKVVRTILEKLELYLSSCQLGITISSLVLGWLAEPAVAQLLLVIFENLGIAVNTEAIHIVALVLALTTITILHMTIGEQAPKLWAIHSPEPMALATAYPLYWFTLVLRPFIWLVNGMSNMLLRGVGVQPGGHEAAQDVDELRAILRSSAKAGNISSRQRSFGENILGLTKLQVRHIMLPRIDVAYLTTTKTADENMAVIREGGHSRFPFGDPDLDHVIGMIHSKDVMGALISGDRPTDLRPMVRPIPSVPDTQLLARLILDMQKQQTQCALVVDEHGTTVGMVFFEDALEEIVGPIHDEFDKQQLWIEGAVGGVVEMAGSVSLPEAADFLGVDGGVEEDTIGGYLTAQLGQTPKPGDTVQIGRYTATVVAMARRRVARIRFDPAALPDAKSK